jgi:hypothetical protein
MGVALRPIRLGGSGARRRLKALVGKVDEQAGFALCVMPESFEVVSW